MARVFGTMAQVWVNPEKSDRPKFASRSIWGVFLGLSTQSKGWEFYIPETREHGYLARAAVFHENLTYRAWMRRGEWISPLQPCSMRKERRCGCHHHRSLEHLHNHLWPQKELYPWLQEKHQPRLQEEHHPQLQKMTQPRMQQKIQPHLQQMHQPLKERRCQHRVGPHQQERRPSLVMVMRLETTWRS